MDRMMKHLTLSRGAAAALLLTAIAPAIRAQETEPARTRPRGDTVVLRVFGGRGIPMDSLRTLIRVWEREPVGSADWVTITRHVDSVLLAQRAAAFARGMIERQFQPRLAATTAPPSGWLGFLTQGPSEQIVDASGQHVIYFAHPTIISVDPNSPAERAGIAPGDVLVAYNGLDVVNRDFNITQLLRPERKLGITVRRDGESKEFSVTVAHGPQRIKIRRRDLESAGTALAAARLEAGDPSEPLVGVPMPPRPPTAVPPMPAGARMFVLPANGMFGASLAAVSAELAKALNLKLGVLATDVPEDSPAWRDGLRSGDVIVTVEGVPVRSVNEFRDRVLTHLQKHAVALQVVRNQKPRTLTLSWSSP